MQLWKHTLAEYTKDLKHICFHDNLASTHVKVLPPQNLLSFLPAII